MLQVVAGLSNPGWIGIGKVAASQEPGFSAGSEVLDQAGMHNEFARRGLRQLISETQRLIETQRKMITLQSKTDQLCRNFQQDHALDPTPDLKQKLQEVQDITKANAVTEEAMGPSKPCTSIAASPEAYGLAFEYSLLNEPYTAAEAETVRTDELGPQSEAALAAAAPSCPRGLCTVQVLPASPGGVAKAEWDAVFSACGRAGPLAGLQDDGLDLPAALTKSGCYGDVSHDDIMDVQVCVYRAYIHSCSNGKMLTPPALDCSAR